MSALGKKLAGYGADVPRRSCTINIGDETITLYATPLTGVDIDKLLKKYPDFGTNPSTSAVAEIIISKAETEDGDKAFDLEDKPLLRRLPLQLLSRIRLELFEDDENMSDERIEEDEKN